MRIAQRTAPAGIVIIERAGGPINVAPPSPAPSPTARSSPNGAAAERAAVYGGLLHRYRQRRCPPALRSIAPLPARPRQGCACSFGSPAFIAIHGIGGDATANCALMEGATCTPRCRPAPDAVPGCPRNSAATPATGCPRSALRPIANIAAAATRARSAGRSWSSPRGRQSRLPGRVRLARRAASRRRGLSAGRSKAQAQGRRQRRLYACMSPRRMRQRAAERGRR